MFSKVKIFKHLRSNVFPLAGTLVLLLLVGLVMNRLQPSPRLLLAERSQINELRYTLVSAALELQSLQPYIQKAQAAKARYEGANQRLQELEEELSKRYTGGRLRLNEALEFVPKDPAPVPAAPVSAAPKQPAQSP